MEQMRILGSDLLGLLGRVGYAKSNDSTREYITSIYLKRLTNRLVAVATDGHRLAVDWIEKEPITDTLGLWDVSIPSPILVLLKESSAGKDLVIERLDQSLWSISCFDRSCLRWRVIWDSTVTPDFPPYNQVIPDQWEHEITGNVKEVKRRINELTKLDRKHDSDLLGSFYLDRLDNAVVVGSRAYDEMLWDDKKGALNTATKSRVYVHPAYLYDTLRDQFRPGDNFILGISGALDPIVVLNTDNRVRAVIMPRRF